MPPPDDVVPALEVCDTRYLAESDWGHLRRLRNVVAGGADAAHASEVLEEIGRSGRNGMVVAIEVDVRGLYALETSNLCRSVPKEQFAGLDTAGLRALVLARIDALRPGVCDVPEAVYRVETHTIEFDGEPIAVREIARRDWDYLLYVAASDPSSHFVDICYGSHAVYSVVKRLSTEDSALLAGGALADGDLDRLVDRYR
jgi:hypothetical protein